MISSLRCAISTHHRLCSALPLRHRSRGPRSTPPNSTPTLVISTRTRHASSSFSSNKDKKRNQDDLLKDLNPKRKAPISTANLVPGSQRPIVDEAAREEYAKAESTMRAAVDWFRKECAAAGSRASGRVTPALLDPVRVQMTGSNGTVGLEQVATVGVRDGTTLIVAVFDEHMMKQVERAIYEAKIPHVVPQKHDGRTIKIPIPKPTVEARIAEYTTQHQKSEDIRVQIRKAFQTSIKRGKYGKRSVEMTEFQKLSDHHVSEIDHILANLKRATGIK